MGLALLQEGTWHAKQPLLCCKHLGQRVAQHIICLATEMGLLRGQLAGEVGGAGAGSDDADPGWLHL